MPYLDDILIYRASFSEHVNHVCQVLQRLRSHGIKLKPCKCELFKHCVKYLGGIVTSDGYSMDPDYLKPMTVFREKLPQNVGELCCLMGMLGYFHRFIQDDSKIAQPIFDMLEKPKEKKEQNCKTRNNLKNSQLPLSTDVVWNKVQKNALDKLITATTTMLILSYPDFGLPFMLHTDALEDGLGCILYQQQQGKLRVIGYGSQTLTDAEKNYQLHSNKLEFLCLYWTITDHFRDYLYYAKDFVVYMDNNPLLYVTSTAKLNACGQHWVNELADYNFSIKYHPGKMNRDADCLSRAPLDIAKYMDLCMKEAWVSEISTILSNLKHQKSPTNISVNKVAVEKSFVELQNQFMDVKDNHLIDQERIKHAQEQDPVVSCVIDLVRTKKRPTRQQ